MLILVGFELAVLLYCLFFAREIIIEEASSLYEAQLSEREPDDTLMDDVSEDEIVAADDGDDVGDDELFTGELDMDSINALAEADENEDDYSFLNDE